MNEADSKIKQQIISKIGSSTNILVTVSKDPSVDELSAALGLTALLNKIGKHATAIFSGVMPPAINFLDPGKVFENTADSLRDFIIALDKEKADHLRYKVEGDVVKIFITPYRTTINSDDLDFSQGDYNIELVLALGVENQEHLDAALVAHNGQILNDVAIITFSAGSQASRLGSMDWRDNRASSLSEMVASIGDSLNGNKPILDKQISTALLTGIVAATDRFSNNFTSSRVMTVAAQLMAAGADQQLIAAKLQESHEINILADVPVEQEDKKSITEIEPIVLNDENQSSTLPVGSLVVDHQVDATSKAEQALDNIVSGANTASTLSSNEPISVPEVSQPAVVEEPSTVAPTYVAEPSLQNVSTVAPDSTDEPLLGGTLNATTDQAAEDTRRDVEDQQNKTILTHSYLSDSGPNDIAGPQPIVQPPIPDLPLPPQLPDFSTLPLTPSVPNFGMPVMAPQPEVSTIPPQPNNDPAQFRIPGQ